MPATFDWDLWLGPAPKRSFVDRWPGAAMGVLGRRLDWDPGAMAFPNRPEATRHLTPEYQNGWTL